MVPDDRQGRDGRHQRDDAAMTARVAVGDVELAYEDHGRGERALVLVHGFTGGRDDFADVVPRLTDLGRVVALDQRGHGDSSNPGTGYTFEQLVDDLRGFLDAVGVARADLLGHSMGGMVALRFALAHPARVASLLLMDSSARGVPELQYFSRAVEGVRRNGMRRLIEMSGITPLSGEDLVIARIEGEERHRARIRAKLEALDPAAFVAIAPLLTEHESVAHRLHELRCPVTVLVGEHDTPFLPRADELASGIAGATLVRIAGAGHSPQKSGREAWVEAVRAHVVRARAAG